MQKSLSSGRLESNFIVFNGEDVEFFVELCTWQCLENIEIQKFPKRQMILNMFFLNTWQIVTACTSLLQTLG